MSFHNWKLIQPCTKLWWARTEPMWIRKCVLCLHFVVALTLYLTPVIGDCCQHYFVFVLNWQAIFDLFDRIFQTRCNRWSTRAFLCCTAVHKCYVEKLALMHSFSGLCFSFSWWYSHPWSAGAFLLYCFRGLSFWFFRLYGHRWTIGHIRYMGKCLY